MGACGGAGNARRVAPHIFRLAETLLFGTDLVRSLRNFPPRTAHRPTFAPVPLAARGAASGRCYWQLAAPHGRRERSVQLICAAGGGKDCFSCGRLACDGGPLSPLVVQDVRCMPFAKLPGPGRLVLLF